jgi:hypothetical protein
VALTVRCKNVPLAKILLAASATKQVAIAQGEAYATTGQACAIVLQAIMVRLVTKSPNCISLLLICKIDM